jgi:hypothetical protein
MSGHAFKPGDTVGVAIAGHEHSGRVCDVLVARDGSRSLTVLLSNGWQTSVPESAVRTEAE